MTIILIVSVILLAIGVLKFFQQLAKGLNITNLNDDYSWGIYIAGFFLLASIGAGALAFLAISVLLGIGLTSKLMVYCLMFSLGLIIGSLFVLGADVGRPLKIYKMVTNFNLQSPLTWDFYLSASCLILIIIGIALGGNLGSGALIWAILALAASIGFIMVHTLFLRARVQPGFRSEPFEGTKIIVDSLLAGSVLVALIGITVQQSIQFDSFIQGWLLILVVLNLMASLVGAVSSRSLLSSTKENISGNVANILILVLLVLPIDLLIKYILIALTIVISGLREKHQLVLQTQEKTHPLPISKFYPKGGYTANFHEWLLVLGGFGIAIFIGSIGYLIF